MIEAYAQGAMIPVERSFAAWREDPKYVEAYNGLEDEFARAAAMVEACKPLTPGRPTSPRA